MTEGLEARRLLSVVVNGDQSLPNQADTFVVNRSGSLGRIFVNGSGTPAATWDVNVATPVTINGLGGNDTLTVDFAAGTPLSSSGLTFEGGTGTNGVSLLDSTSAETVTFVAGQVQWAGRNVNYLNTASLTASLSAGNDTINASGDSSVTAGTFQINTRTSGTLRLGSTTSMPSFAGVAVSSGSAFDLAGRSVSINVLSGAGTVTNNGGAATLTIGAADGSGTFSGAINNGSGAISLTKAGEGRITLTGNSNYTGVTAINGGFLRATANNALGANSGSISISGGTQTGALELSGNLVLAESITLFAKNIDGTGAILPSIINVSGDTALTGAVQGNSGGTGYTLRADAGRLRITGGFQRVDASAFHRPFQFRGAGDVVIEQSVTSSTSWGMTWQKFDAGDLTVIDDTTSGSMRVDGGTFTVNRVSTGTTTVNGGALIVPEVSGSSAPFATSTLPSLTVAGAPDAPAGALDLGNSALVLDYSGASPIGAIEDLLRGGFAGGTWTGNGIRSSTAATAAASAADRLAVGVVEATDLYSTFPQTFAGRTIDATSVLAELTIAGDANLDGRADVSDFSTLAARFGQTGRWANGDFDYDGSVGIGDFSQLAANFNKVFSGKYVAWESVPSANFGAISPFQFTDAELRYAQPLFWFSQVANAVLETGPNRGFINLSVWRDPPDNEPYNARVLENHVAFAFFYSTNRPWNPYYNSRQVRNRLEAIMDFWARSQSPDGQWSEYSPTNFSLAPTSFGLRAMVRTLELLLAPGAPAIDPGVMQRTVGATLDGLRRMLATDFMLNAGNDYSNQYSAIYGTALIFARLFPQHAAELNGYLAVRVPQASAQHQSPAGFMYEAGGPDFPYTLGTHQTNLTNGWHELRGSPYQQELVDETQKLYEWMGYNLVRQPDGSGYASNAGVNARLNGRFFTVGHNANPLTEFVPEARFLSRTAAEESAALTSQRSSLSSNWGNWGPLAVPSSSSFSPVPFVDIDRVGWRPTDSQRTASINALPYLASTNFNHQAADSRRSQQYTFVRRPSYYGIFNSGVRITSLQRLGLGHLWHPTMGSVLQVQHNTDTSNWGTRASGASRVYEGNGLTGGTFSVGGTSLTPTPGSTRLANGDMVITYPLGGAGTKTVTFDATGITVSITHTGNFSEELPLLRKSENVIASAGLATLTRNGVTMRVEFNNGATPTVSSPGISIGGGLSVTNVVVQASGSLTYRITFT